MFERYSEKARRVIFLSRDDASQLGSPNIEPEHLLLGLLREDKQLFSALLSPDDSVTALVEELQQNLPKQAATPNSGDIPFGNSAKRCLAFAAEEAERLKDREITSGHLLLSLLQEDSRASEFLTARGVALTSAREKVVRLHISTRKAAEAMEDLKREFAPLVRRLTCEIEPVTVFSLRPPTKENAS